MKIMSKILYTVLLCVILTVSGCNGFFVPKTGKSQYPGKNGVLKQKVIFELFQNILQNNTHELHNVAGLLYNPEDHLDSYVNSKVLQELMDFIRNGQVQKSEVFDLNNEKHLEEAKALFKVFYNAKDWLALYQVMCWARNTFNDRVFVYAFSVALVHREDLRGNELPPLFEVYPHYFINSDIIFMSQLYQMSELKDDVTIPVKYSGSYINTGKDQQLSYYTEDVGLNQFFYYFNLDYPAWMTGDEFSLHKDRRGELYLFTIRQLLARYELERLSNGLDFVPELLEDFTSTIAYHSSLRHHNGLDFPHRSVGYSYNNLSNVYDYITTATDYEHQIRKALDAGFVMTKDGKNIDFRNPNAINELGNLFQGNADSVNVTFFKTFVSTIKHILVNTFETVGEYPYPSELDYTFTELRDPATYQIFKKIFNILNHFYSHLPIYSINNLGFLGVKIQNVDLDDLVTYFDTYRYDITNSIYSKKSYAITALQKRLRSKPFTYNITVTSQKSVEAVIRVFIGPNFDSLDQFEQFRDKFFQADVFKYKLKEGENIITRLSSNYNTVVKDSMSIADLYKETIEAVKDNFTWNFDNAEAHCGFPERLLLPKGTEDGFAYKFLFFISEFNPPTVPQFEGFNANYSCGVGSGARYVDDLPLGFPLDRQIHTEALTVPNMYFKDVVITYDEKLGALID